MVLSLRVCRPLFKNRNHPTKIAVICTAIIIMVSTVAIATNDKDEKNIHQIVKLMQEQERSLITEYVQLSDDEAPRFWAVFMNYQDDTYEMLSRKVTLIQTLAGHPPPRSRELSDSIIAEWIDLNITKLKIKKSYVKNFGEILPPEKLLDLMILARSIDVGFFLKAVSETKILE